MLFGQGRMLWQKLQYRMRVAAKLAILRNGCILVSTLTMHAIPDEARAVKLNNRPCHAAFRWQVLLSLPSLLGSQRTCGQDLLLRALQGLQLCQWRQGLYGVQLLAQALSQSWAQPPEDATQPV